MAKEKRFCQRCGALFDGISTSHFCDVCKKLNKLEYGRKYYRKNAKEITDKKRKKYNYIYNEGNFPKKEEFVDIFEGSEKRYCSSYDDCSLECIKCFENQIKEYKKCGN